MAPCSARLQIIVNYCIGVHPTDLRAVLKIQLPRPETGAAAVGHSRGPGCRSYGPSNAASVRTEPSRTACSSPGSSLQNAGAHATTTNAWLRVDRVTAFPMIVPVFGEN